MNLHLARTSCFVALFFSSFVSLAVAAETAEKTSTSAPAAAAAPASGEKYLLRYKFAMGEDLRYDVKVSTKLRNIQDETREEVETDTESVKSWRVTDVLPNGEIEFMHVVEWIKMSNQSPGLPVNKFDSRTKDPVPQGFSTVARAIGIPLSIVRIAPDGKVTFREQKHPQQKPQEDMPITLGLPVGEIAVGEKWSHPYNVTVPRKGGAMRQIQTRRVCKLRDVKNGVAIIDVEYQILTPVDSYAQSQLVDRLTDGTVRFDIAKGRTIAQEHNIDKRILGHSSKASSLHFVSKLQERLLPSEVKGAKSEVQQASAVIETKPAAKK
ncbi:hypothetical protein [Lacipirellula sp.]|uniref:hypothetical protein n=1 Tax=Lacipirellula sp. TaxID=2691419 RepID=UPI003D0E4BE2